MDGIQVAVEIVASPADTWAAVSQLDRHVEWMADAESISFVGENRSGKGTVMDVATRVGPLRTVDRIEVTAWEPPTRIDVVHRGLVSGVGTFELSPSETGTRFAWSEELTFPWYAGGAVTAFFASPVLKQIWKRNLRRFATMLESGAFDIG